MSTYNDNAPIPEMVKQFIVYLYRHIREKNVGHVLHIYDISFSKITELYYKEVPWPRAERLSYLVDDDHVFCLLYREIYYRHLYAICRAKQEEPSLQDQTASWENYCQLFGIILMSNVNMHLPALWLWNMVDEFLYHYQKFNHFRARLLGKSPEEVAALKASSQVWDAASVKNYLQALSEKSGVEKILEEEFEGNTSIISNSEASDVKSNVLTLLGYYSLVGKMRVHCLLGEYEEALRASEPARLAQKGALTHVPAVHVEAYYCMGFAYMMVHRYVDAMRTFNAILNYALRNQQALAKTNGGEQILKKTEQISALLAVCTSLCPTTRFVDDAILERQQEKHSDVLQKMARMEEQTYDDLFSLSCPKFTSPKPPDFTQLVNQNQEAYRLQLKEFMTEVKEQTGLAELRQQLKLYTSISVSKLAKQMGIDQEKLKGSLHLYKTKNEQLQWSGGASSLSGVLAVSSDMDFEIVENDIINTRTVAAKKNCTDYFSRNTKMLTEVVKGIERKSEAAVTV